MLFYVFLDFSFRPPQIHPSLWIEKSCWNFRATSNQVSVLFHPMKVQQLWKRRIEIDLYSCRKIGIPSWTCTTSYYSYHIWVGNLHAVTSRPAGCRNHFFYFLQHYSLNRSMSNRACQIDSAVPPPTATLHWCSQYSNSKLRDFFLRPSLKTDLLVFKVVLTFSWSIFGTNCFEHHKMFGSSSSSWVIRDFLKHPQAPVIIPVHP